MNIDTRIGQILTALETALPGRIVTRSFQHQLDDAAMRKGHLSLVAAGARDFDKDLDEANVSAALIGRLMVTESDECKQGLAVEQAELAFFREVQDVINTSETLCSLEITDMNQSRQLEAPYGWWVANLNWREV